MMKPWDELTTREFADEIRDRLLHALDAHTQHPNQPDDGRTRALTAGCS